jgi:hypothetical protein
VDIRGAVAHLMAAPVARQRRPRKKSRPVRWRARPGRCMRRAWGVRRAACVLRAASALLYTYYMPYSRNYVHRDADNFVAWNVARDILLGLCSRRYTWQRHCLPALGGGRIGGDLSPASSLTLNSFQLYRKICSSSAPKSM